jgi:Ring finger domain
MFIIASTSCSMHWLQKRRRERLRRRVANGEVDLEQLGIKKLTVPPEYLEKMPIYTFPEETENSNDIEKAAGPSDQSTTANPVSQIQPKAATPKTAYSQPTCAICLEDFAPGESIVRELPCRHIFHSECVDTFLRENSSLCPLCKKTSLPRGYCPPVITNAMVRRERMMRRMRDRVPDPEAQSRRPWNPDVWRRAAHSVLSLPNRLQRERTSSSAPQPPATAATVAAAASTTATTTPQPTELVTTNVVSSQPMPAPTSTSNTPAPTTQPQGSGSEWARQRALEMAGVQASEEEQSEQQIPRWKKVASKIWPGIG